MCLSECKWEMRGDRMCDLGGHWAVDSRKFLRSTCASVEGIVPNRIILPAGPCLCRLGPVPSLDSSATMAGRGGCVGTGDGSSLGSGSLLISTAVGPWHEQVRD